MLKIKILITTISCLFFATVCQITYASTDAETLQPATPAEATKVGDLGRYFDEYSSYIQLDTALHSSETMHLPDVHIGGTDGTTGGVTFFNGTIINASKGNFPVTFGDDVRIDGMIWRDQKGTATDNRPVLFGDSVSPAIDDANLLGESGKRWKEIYISDRVYGENIIFEDNLSVTNTPTENYYLGYAGNSQFAWMNVADHDTLSGLACSDGQIAVYDSATTSWTCANDSDTLDGLTCLDGQTAVYNLETTSWVCSDVPSNPLSGLSCNDGEIITYDLVTESWICAELCTLVPQCFNPIN